MSQKYINCPKCHTQIPVYTDYNPWCECGYNLSIDNEIVEERRKNLLEKWAEKLAERHGKTIYEQMINHRKKKKRLLLTKVCAFTIATLIYLSSIFTFLMGIYFLTQYDHWFLLVSGILLLSISWFIRPKAAKLPKHEKIILQKDFPELYGMMEEISKEMGVKMVDGIIINEEYNASISKIGFKGKVIVRIGLPFFSILKPDEQCAVIAHELGHFANKDLLTNSYLVTALYTLMEWYDLLNPIPYGENAEYSILEILSDFLMKTLALIPFTLYALLLHLMYMESQKDEYLADARAAKLCGSSTMVEVLKKMHCDDLYYYSLTKAAQKTNKKNVIQLFQQQLQTLPEREKKKRELLLKNQMEQWNTSHHIHLLFIAYNTLKNFN